MNRNEDKILIKKKKGGRFVRFSFCISILILSFQLSSRPYFIMYDESTARYSIGYTLISLIFGWWGIPWGPIRTVQSLVTNFRGGEVDENLALQAMMLSYTGSENEKENNSQNIALLDDNKNEDISESTDKNLREA